MAKSTQVQLRVTESEKSTLKVAADAEGVTLTEFVLQAALDRAKGVHKEIGAMIPYVRLGRYELPVRDVLSGSIIMRVEDKK